jgi:thiosulfate reductase cytochrome b subunit
VDELRSVCRAHFARHEQVHLDLGAVAFVDAAGAALLRELTAQGVVITRCKGFVAELLRSERFPWATVAQGLSSVSSEPLKGEECHHAEADFNRGRSSYGSESELGNGGMQQDAGQFIGQDGNRQDEQDGHRQDAGGQDGHGQDEHGQNESRQDGHRQDGEKIGAPRRPAEAAAEVRLEPKHPRAIRWMHWINFPVLAVMIGSGLLIYWANDVYSLGPVHFFPDWFYRLLHLDHGLAVGMAYHFVFMWVFAINGACYVLYTFLSGEWRHLLPNRHTLREAWEVILHDLKIREAPLPRAKFNGAQRLAYTGVILMGAGSLLTGLAIYKPTQFAWLTNLLGGYAWARAEHFALALAYVVFFLVHITQVVRAGWNNFRAMVTGYELVVVETPRHE